MASKCKVIYNEEGKIEEVLAPNNDRSRLFSDLVKLNEGDLEVSAEQWLATYSKEFAMKFTNAKTDINGEFVLNNKMIDFLQSTEWGNTVRKSSPEDVYKKVSISLNTLYETYTRQSVNKDTSTVQEIIASLDKAKKAIATDKKTPLYALMNYVQTAQLNLVEFQKDIEWVKDHTQSLGTKTDLEITKIMERLNHISTYASSYSVLDDIIKVYNENTDKIAQPEIDKVSLTIALRSKIIADYTKYAKGTIAEWLFRAAEPFNRQVINNKEYSEVLTKDQLIKELDFASKDLGYFSSLLGAAVNASDPIVALVGLKVKEKVYQSRDASLKAFRDLADLYTSLPGNKDNPAKFNEKYIHIIQQRENVKVTDSKGKSILDDVNGEPLTESKLVNRKALVTEFRWDRYDENKRKLWAAVRETSNNFIQMRMQVKWMNENTDAIENVEEIIQQKRETLSEPKFRYWLQKNLITESASAGYKKNLVSPYGPKGTHEVFLYAGELITPTKSKPEYKSKKWDAIKDDKYFQKLSQTYIEANLKIPSFKQLKYGILPQIEKSALDAAIDGKNAGFIAGSKLKRGVGFVADSEYDLEYGGNIAGLETAEGELLQQVPIYYTTLLDEELVSEDLFQSITKYDEMANKYKAYAEIEPQINAVSNVVLGSKALGIKARGVAMDLINGLPALGNKGTRLQKVMDEKANEKLKTFLDMIYYQQDKKLKATLFGKEINLDKAAGLLGTATAVSSLVSNFVAAANNLLIGNFSLALESAWGEYMTPSSWGRAELEYATSLPQILADASKIHNQSIITQIAIQYDAIQGEYLHQSEGNISGSLVKRAFSTDTLFILTNSFEHQIQITGMIGLMKSTKVQTTSGKEIELLDAYELKNGRLALKSGVKWSQKDETAFRNRLHALNKRMHGIYNSFDKNALQAYAIGRLAMMFRKYVYTGFKNRYGTKYRDFEEGNIHEGFYRTVFNALGDDIKRLKFEMLINWSPGKWSDRQKIAGRKAVFELGTILALGLAFKLIDDDDDEEILGIDKSLILLLIRRFQADLLFFSPLSPGDTLRVFSTPTVSLNLIQQIVEALNYTRLWAFDSDKAYYKRKTGKYAEGTPKAYKHWRDIVPILRHFDTVSNPKEILEFYKKK